MPIDETIGKVIDLVLMLIPVLKPSDLQKIKNAIKEKEEQNEKDRQKVLEAVANGDVDTINMLLNL